MGTHRLPPASHWHSISQHSTPTVSPNGHPFPLAPVSQNTNPFALAPPYIPPSYQKTALLRRRATPCLPPAGTPDSSTTDSSTSCINPHISPFFSTPSAGSSTSYNSTSFNNLRPEDTSNSEPSSPVKRRAPMPDSPLFDVNNGKGRVDPFDVVDDDELPPLLDEQDNEDDLPIIDLNVPRGVGGPARSTNSSTSATPTDILAELPDEERRFRIYFNLFQPQCPDEPDPKKQKRPPGGSRPISRKPTKVKYNNYAPKVPTYITFQPKDMDFTLFKIKLFNSCNKHLPGVSELLQQAWAQGGLSIMGFINGSKGFKARDKQPIKKPSLFDHSPATSKMGFRIVHENPLKSEEARRSLASTLKTSRVGTPANGPDSEVSSEGEESVASDGVSHFHIIPALPVMH
ncbi:uncharacterized protein MELLADRAFT_102413 [Melampsora larici-populina 98AG31]|uniref:Uncharacterized protein n=1 Tax=Melampsora larici-populina (strain 98AG31 / pathotype 3-4-7) TaxID=747676 RepID=F4R879_MELLP|nr:uncharacterized protein MELLADRAFT_102413 [Melampsora larici-populina 98AG31]EGG11660.1 hypothetical protein MELLADRAFT_102413 [Melampsora larici-populina 98AG31]